MPGFSRLSPFGTSISISALEGFAGERVDRHGRRVAGVHQPQVLLDDVGDQTDRADIDHRHHRRLLRGPGSDVDVALADEAIHRRGHAGVAEGDAQFLEARLRLGNLRPREIDLRGRRCLARLGVVERLAGQQVALEEVL